MVEIGVGGGSRRSGEEEAVGRALSLDLFLPLSSPCQHALWDLVFFLQGGEELFAPDLAKLAMFDLKAGKL